MNDSPVRLKDAVPEDAEALTRLALSSKAYWGYSEEFMAACREELTIKAGDIVSPVFHYRLAVKDTEIVGFYAIEWAETSAAELEALFVTPNAIGSGVGRLLLNDAKRLAKARGVLVLHIQGDPNAEDFYRAAGGVLIGKQESCSIPGRFLPRFRITL